MANYIVSNQQVRPVYRTVRWWWWLVHWHSSQSVVYSQATEESSAQTQTKPHHTEKDSRDAGVNEVVLLRKNKSEQHKICAQ